MTRPFWNRVDLFARGLTPFALSLLLVVLSLVPVRLPGLSPITPWVTLIAVFFWTAHRPDLLPLGAVFLLGLFADLAGGGPLGVTSLALMVAQLVVKAQRRHILPHPFIVQWVIFALVALLAEALLVILHVMAYTQALDPGPALFQALMTIALYPLVAWIFVQAQRAFLRAG
jgi:rod shape-determining protein MreD